MKRVVAVFLGILTAIGGFVDIGDLVANAETGARFGMGLAWAVVVGVVGIIVYAEMAGRVAAISGRPVFDLVRDRLGARVALANLVASFLINLLTLAAEIAGVALALQLATSVNYLLWIPLVAFLVWLVLWRMRFSMLEKVFGIMGLALIVFGVALWHLNPAGLFASAMHPAPPPDESWATYAFFAVAPFGAALETALSAGYTVSQYFGWQWGTFVRPKEAPRFHLVVMLSIVFGSLLMLTTVDPIKVTEYSIVLAAAALPLTYFPILVVANDPEFMGDKVNGRITNAIATVYLVLLLIVAVATIPLMIITKAGA